jgi:hypothetical protein
VAEPIIIRDCSDFVDVVRARRDELKLTHEQIDYISGMQSGYTSKLLAPKPLKKLGPVSLWLIATALGLRITVEVDPMMCEKMRPVWDPRLRPMKKMLALGEHRPVTITFAPAMMRALGLRGYAVRKLKNPMLASDAGRHRMAKLSAEERKALARRAAVTRWQRAA